MGIQDEIKQGKFNSSIQKALINTLFTSNWLRDVYNAFFEKHNILLQHYNVLRIVKGQHPNATSPGYIKSVMIDKGPDLTRLIDKMVKLGLLTRKLSPTNRRQVDINITAKGINLANSLEAELNQRMSELLRISESEADHLSELLDKMRGS